MGQFKALKLLIVTAFAANSIACGPIVVDQILALDDTADNFIQLTMFPGSPLESVQDLDVDGGSVSRIVIDNVMQQFIGGNVAGTIDLVDMLWSTTAMNIFGIDTGTNCVVLDPAGANAGTVNYESRGVKQFTIDLVANTAIITTNPALYLALPDGFPFDISFATSQAATLGDMIGILMGRGSLTIHQQVSDFIILTVAIGAGSLDIPTALEVDLTLTSADAFPSSARLTECIDFLANPPTLP
jgi:hypothetical protein